MQRTKQKVEWIADLDKEWLTLISEAKQQGLTSEEVRAFLEKGKKDDRSV